VGVIWSYISLAETAEFVALRAWEARAGGWEIGEEANGARFGRLGGKVFVIFISHLVVTHLE
jgi:hypothetical protein